MTKFSRAWHKYHEDTALLQMISCLESQLKSSPLIPCLSSPKKTFVGRYVPMYVNINYCTCMLAYISWPMIVFVLYTADMQTLAPNFDCQPWQPTDSPFATDQIPIYMNFLTFIAFLLLPFDIWQKMPDLQHQNIDVAQNAVHDVTCNIHM